MTRDEVLTLLGSSTDAFAPTGSRVICDPAPTDTDEDYVCLANATTEAALLAAGFVQTTEADEERYGEMPEFLAYRCAEFNVIATASAGFYERFVAATEEAKRLNLTDKAARISLFQRVLYDDAPVFTDGAQ